jgi:hypothetical protein
MHTVGGTRGLNGFERQMFAAGTHPALTDVGDPMRHNSSSLVALCGLSAVASTRPEPCREECQHDHREIHPDRDP